MFHTIFLSAFATVALVVAITVLFAVARSRRSLSAGRADAIRWHTDFEALPSRDRQCRHVLTGELASRECPHAFDCRECLTHPKLLARRRPVDQFEEEVFGMPYPSDRLYHRGHAWARPESDGTVTIGLDELGRRVLGPPDVTDLPPEGARLSVNGTAWRFQKRDAEVRVLSPVDGEVVAVGAPNDDWYLRVKPFQAEFDFRHLLMPCEIRPWVMREMERLQLALNGTLADGGTPMEDISAAYPKANWDEVCGQLFLQG